MTEPTPTKEQVEAATRYLLTRRFWTDNGQDLLGEERIAAGIADQNDLATLLARREQALIEALQWYAAQVGDCRKLHNEGDKARQALYDDRGERARQALEKAGVK